MPKFTQERTSTHSLKPNRDTVSLPGGDDYTLKALSGNCHVVFADGEIKEITKDGITITPAQKGDHSVLGTTPDAAVRITRRIPDHPNSGVSRDPLPGPEHPLEHQDDPEPPGPPAVLETKSPTGDPNRVQPAENFKQPESSSTRLKATGGKPPVLADLPEVKSVPKPKKPKARTKAKARPPRSPAKKRSKK